MELLNNKIDTQDGELVDQEREQLFAGEWNQVATEGQNLITSSGQALSAADLTQMAKAVAAYSVAGDTYIDTGEADRYLLDPSNDFFPITEYFNGSIINFIAITSNTGESIVNVAGLGDRPFCNLNGDPLAENQIEAGQRITIYFDAFIQQFKLLNMVDVGAESSVPLNSSADLNLSIAIFANRQAIRLEWNAIPDATNVRIETLVAGQIVRTQINPINQTAFNYNASFSSIDGVFGNRDFQFVVTPFNVIGDGAGASQSITVDAPEAVVGLVASNITDETADFTWLSVPNIAGYFLYQVFASGNNITDFRFLRFDGQSTSTNISVDDDQYAVAAYDLWGETLTDLNFSDVISVEAQDIEIPPQNSPLDLQLSVSLASNSTRLLASWSTVEGATSYRLEVVVSGSVVRTSNIPDSGSASLSLLYSPSNAVSDGVFGSRDFAFRVTPLNEFGDGAGDIQSITIPQISAPNIINVDEGSNGEDGQIDFSLVSGAESYVLVRVSGSNPDIVLGTESTFAASPAIINTANNGVEFRRIAGIDVWGSDINDLNFSTVIRTEGEQEDDDAGGFDE